MLTAKIWGNTQSGAKKEAGIAPPIRTQCLLLRTLWGACLPVSFLRIDLHMNK